MRCQDVPLAVSAVTAETLQNSRRQRHSAAEPAQPSLLVSSTSTEASGSARIRGIGTVGDNPGLESSVAVFIDGVYRSRTGVGLTELGEIDRIEVLRGPQGTLFGRNASAGLISIITKKPSFTIGGWRSRRSAITTCAAGRRHHRPAQRQHRRPDRRRLDEARRLLRRRHQRHRRQRPQPLVAARPAAVRAVERPLVPPGRRLYASATRNAAAPSMSTTTSTTISAT